MVLHEPNPMALVAYAIARPGAPLIVWFHSEVIRARWKYRLFYEPLLDRVLRRATRIIVASPPMQDVPALAAHRDKVAVIPFGLDPSGYGPGAPSPSTDLPANRRCCLSAGSCRTRAWTCCCAPWSACRHRSCSSGTVRFGTASRRWPAISACRIVCASWVVSATPNGSAGTGAAKCSCSRPSRARSLRHGAGRGHAVRPAGRQH